MDLPDSFLSSPEYIDELLTTYRAENATRTIGQRQASAKLAQTMREKLRQFGATDLRSAALGLVVALCIETLLDAGEVNPVHRIMRAASMRAALELLDQESR